jgi:hypothetical protein
VIELSDFEAENATLNRDFLRQVFEIVIGGVPTILEVHCMCLIMSVGRIPVQGSVSTNLLDRMTHQVGLAKVGVGTLPLGNIYLDADIIQPSVHSATLLGQRSSFVI